jgi:hypothetical protein
VILTNKHGLPDTIVNVLKRPQYSKGDSHVSVTELLSPPQIVQLRAKHHAEIEQDASEMVWSLFGTAVHNVLEHGKDDHHIVEERIFTDVDGWRISGQIDLQEVYEDGVAIKDYKVTSAWSVQQEKKDWRDQLNIYAWLVEKAKGVEVKSIQIVAIIRDWSRRDALNKEGYPQAPIVTVDIPIMSFDQREVLVGYRLNLHSEASLSVQIGHELPECTADDMWEKPTTYAVKKAGGVRAKRVFDSREEAEVFLKTVKDHEIEVRLGGRTRCASFCNVSQFCSQYQQYLQQTQSTNESGE